MVCLCVLWSILVANPTLSGNGANGVSPLLQMDYLVLRPDVDPARIGVTGFSLGGMHAWLLGALDVRVSAVAAVSGVQGFAWAVRNGQLKARVDSIPKVFEAAREDMQAKVSICVCVTPPCRGRSRLTSIHGSLSPRSGPGEGMRWCAAPGHARVRQTMQTQQQRLQQKQAPVTPCH